MQINLVMFRSDETSTAKSKHEFFESYVIPIQMEHSCEQVVMSTISWSELQNTQFGSC